MQIWRLHMKPDATVDPVAFCLERGVIGIGWRVDGYPATPADYFAAGQAKYGDRGWKAAANAIVHRVQEGDLAWFRDRQGVYYLARVTGPWRYRAEPEFHAADLMNSRDAEIVRIGPVAPGKVVTSFRARMTLRRVSGATVAAVSKLEFNAAAGREAYSGRPPEHSRGL